jgi:hypothetical protein
VREAVPASADPTGPACWDPLSGASSGDIGLSGARSRGGTSAGRSALSRSDSVPVNRTGPGSLENHPASEPVCSGAAAEPVLVPRPDPVAGTRPSGEPTPADPPADLTTPLSTLGPELARLTSEAPVSVRASDPPAAAPSEDSAAAGPPVEPPTAAPPPGEPDALGPPVEPPTAAPPPGEPDALGPPAEPAPAAPPSDPATDPLAAEESTAPVTSTDPAGPAAAEAADAAPPPDPPTAALPPGGPAALGSPAEPAPAAPPSDPVTDPSAAEESRCSGLSPPSATPGAGGLAVEGCVVLATSG